MLFATSATNSNNPSEKLYLKVIATSIKTIPRLLSKINVSTWLSHQLKTGRNPRGGTFWADSTCSKSDLDKQSSTVTFHSHIHISALSFLLSPSWGVHKLYLAWWKRIPEAPWRSSTRWECWEYPRLRCHTSGTFPSVGDLVTGGSSCSAEYSNLEEWQRRMI